MNTFSKLQKIETRLESLTVISTVVSSNISKVKGWPLITILRHIRDPNIDVLSPSQLALCSGVVL